ncbi:MAG TPA: GxxExxY protein [Kofleriaceae bacterium]
MKQERSYDPVPPSLNELTHTVIGAAIEVHRWLGPGYLETLYEEALHIELRLRGIPFESQVAVSIPYKGHVVGRSQLDLVVANELIVELKAVETVLEIHRAQVLSYLRATGSRLGLLINFNTPCLRDGVRRVIWDPE